MGDEAPAFVDTNILVYAFDSTDPTGVRVVNPFRAEAPAAFDVRNPA